MTDEEKAIKAMNIRENFMTTNRSGASTLNGRRPESEQRLNVSRPSHGRKLGLLRLWLHGVSRRAHSALCEKFAFIVTGSIFFQLYGVSDDVCRETLNFQILLESPKFNVK